MDPRIEVIDKRLQGIDTLIPVASGKGGVGKSLTASTMALIASKRGKDVGLLDLDLHGPSAHVILGTEDLEFPEEDKGVICPQVAGMRFMSTVYYSQDGPSPLRGSGISDSIKELLSISRWGSLDYLFVDMPPGVGNEVLDTINLVKNPQFMVVTTPSDVALRTVEKLVLMLNELDVPISGVIENMRNENSPDIEDEVREFGTDHLGKIWFDNEIEQAIGKPEKILQSDFSKDLRQVFDNVSCLPSSG